MSPLTRSSSGRGRLALLRPVGLVGLAAVFLSCGPADVRRPNVVVWLVDTLRADHLGCYGYPRPTSPNFDRLAADGVLFEQFHVHSNWTQASITSLLSGVYPPQFTRKMADKIPPGVVLLSEWFSRHGYATYGVTQNGATASDYGYARGFDTYRHLFGRGAFGKPLRGKPKASELVEEALVMLDEWAERGADAPFFLFLQSADPHEPYTDHEDGPDFTGGYDGPIDGSVKTLRAIRKGTLPTTPEDRRHLVDLYDEEIAFNDAQFGRFRAALEERGLAEDTVLVLVSDHGEEMFEHGGQGHAHRNLHRELTHVPLVLHWPGVVQGGRRLERLVGGIDFAPTLVELAGLPRLPSADGLSLAAAVRGERTLAEIRPGAPLVYIHHCIHENDLMAVRGEDLLFVLDPDAARFGAGSIGQGEGGGEGDLTALYDLKADPAETIDVSADHPDRVEELSTNLARFEAYRSRSAEARGVREEVKLGPELRRALEEFGYLD